MLRWPWWMLGLSDSLLVCGEIWLTKTRATLHGMLCFFLNFFKFCYFLDCWLERRFPALFLTLRPSGSFLVPLFLRPNCSKRKNPQSQFSLPFRFFAPFFHYIVFLTTFFYRFLIYLIRSLACVCLMTSLKSCTRSCIAACGILDPPTMRSGCSTAWRMASLASWFYSSRRFDCWIVLLVCLFVLLTLRCAI